MIRKTGGTGKLRQHGIGGDARIIYYHHKGSDVIFLIACYAKSGQKDLSEAEKKEIGALIKDIKDSARKRRP